MKNLSVMQLAGALILVLLGFYLLKIVAGLVSAALAFLYYVAVVAVVGGIGWVVWTQVIAPRERKIPGPPGDLPPEPPAANDR